MDTREGRDGKGMEGKGREGEQNPKRRTKSYVI
jgi:hypothetical protein